MANFIKFGKDTIKIWEWVRNGGRMLKISSTKSKFLILSSWNIFSKFSMPYEMKTKLCCTWVFRVHQFGFTGTPISPENAIGLEPTASVLGCQSNLRFRHDTFYIREVGIFCISEVLRILQIKVPILIETKSCFGNKLIELRITLVPLSIQVKHLFVR